MSIRVAINGFGRIGRNLFRLLLDHSHIEVAVINDVAPAATLAHLLKYDSIHGVLKREVSSAENALVIDGQSVPVLKQPELQKLSWTAYDVDVVVECTGKFKTRAELQAHLQEGIKKVILSVPPLDDSIKMVERILYPMRPVLRIMRLPC